MCTVLKKYLLCQGREDDLSDFDEGDCHPGPASSEDACRTRNYPWCPGHIRNFWTRTWCSCPGSADIVGYVMVGEPTYSSTGVKVSLRLAKSGGSGQWKGKAKTLVFAAEFQSDYRLRVKISDETDTNRWEVPLVIQPPSGGATNLLYEVEFHNDPTFSYKIVRKSSGAVLFDSKVSGASGSFVFADQYLSLAWKLPSTNVYGLGENEQHSFRHDFSRNLVHGLWTSDQPPDFLNNMYGVQPHYTVLESDGSAHAVAIVNSNAQEFGMLMGADGPYIRYRTIGGVFDFYFFLGPTPENTVQQYTEAVGRAEIPPYWALGFHLCRWGYNSLTEMQAAVDRTAQYCIPHDVQYGDIDIMERQLDFTYDKTNFAGLPEYIAALKHRGIKFVTILDPGISIGEPTGSYEAFELGNQMEVWMKRADGSNAVGRVWPEDPVYFPDYSKNSTREWWIELLRKFNDLLDYDGLWIDMNEPANFVTGDVDGCANNKWNNPPFIPSVANDLKTKTVCPDNIQAAGRHYDTHSLYGWFQSEPTLSGARAATGKRSFVLSRSTFLGSGKWVAHWLGDNWSKWSNLHYSIIGILQFNQFGIPFCGADIGGFIGNANAAMCQRWMQLGAFYPFARNHNMKGSRDQDPGSFGADVAISSRNALNVRYTLLPYLYTLFYTHHTAGNTVVRAPWHVFPTDETAAGVDRQFFWGTGVYISAVLDEGALSVEAYFPDSRFYSYYTGAEVTTRGATVTLDAPRDFIHVHIHGGNIIPTQEPAVNTEISRNNAFGLIVALDDNGSASGELFYDDGDSIDTVGSGEYFLGKYAATTRTLTATVENDGWSGMGARPLSTIRLLGARAVTTVTLNGAPHTDFSTLPSGEVVVTNLGLNGNSAFTLTY